MAVGQEKIKQIDEAGLKAVGAFGGGIASSGSVCGILLGGVALISSIYSRGNLREKEDPRMWTLSHALMKKFAELTEEFGGSNCSDIAQVNWRDRNAVKEYYANPESRRQICSHLLGETAFYLGELLAGELTR